MALTLEQLNAADTATAVQLLDGFSMPLTMTLFKQYMRRRKGGTARKARDANIPTFLIDREINGSGIAI